jgi:hypothetical protein
MVKPVTDSNRDLRSPAQRFDLSRLRRRLRPTLLALARQIGGSGSGWGA